MLNQFSFRLSFNTFLGSALALGMLVSCGGSTDKEAETLYSIINGGKSNGHFRGVSIRDTKDEVKNTETLNLQKDSVGELVYHAVISKDPETSLKVYYTFDQYGLFEIQSDVYLSTSEDLDLLIGEFKSAYDKKYGKAEQTISGYSWTTSSAVNSVVEIRVSEEKNGDNNPFLSINFFEPMEDEI